MKKIFTGSLLVLFIVIVIVAVTLYFFRDKFSILAQEETVNQSEETLSIKDPLELRRATIKIDTETVPGSTSSMSLGFNNAEQVVFDGNGTNVVWIAENTLFFVTRSEDGAVTNTQKLAEGKLSLPAVTRDGNLVGVGWVERTSQVESVKTIISTDGGLTWGNTVTLGSGSGISLAASENTIVGVWFEGKQDASSKIMMRLFADDQWSEASRVDQSTKNPLWPSVDIRGNDLFVTWRDNREGVVPYSIWLRRSSDLGTTWQNEQHLVTKLSGDPDVCVSKDRVWLAHHGSQKITLLESQDQGETFTSRGQIGSGFFAHLSCTDTTVAVAWEHSTNGAKSDDKKVGWAIFTSNGEELGTGLIDDGRSAATTIYVSHDSRWAEILWLKKEAEDPLKGTLRHQILSLESL
ncbi:MAG: glycoside hydrolase [Candidatus Uhrbacteria bacterium]|nr:glycoside hydrolase [Candidatus Uhrbacteria bacterium]